jgi:hypothetical protein
MFGVVEELPRLVRLLNLRPGARIGEAKVGEPPLDREQGFGVIFPGFPCIDPFVADSEHLIVLERQHRTTRCRIVPSLLVC